MVKLNNRIQPKFQIGQLVATPGALEALQQANQSPMEFIRRHIAGDWGDLGNDDKRQNEEAIANEHTAGTENDLRDRIVSVYKTKQGKVLWIITEWNRELTTILLPEDY
jgi:hypothetical protein